MTTSLAEKLSSGASGLCFYGFAPPKRATQPERLRVIVAQQLARFAALPIDALVVYDIQDEAERTAAPRPFPFLPTLDPERYAYEQLAAFALPKIVYRRVDHDTPESFVRWLQSVEKSVEIETLSRMSVLVGAPSRRSPVRLPLMDAYALARRHAPDLVVGGIAIAERHARRLDEHERLLRKAEQGCRFFITQAVYDVTSTKSLLSDYALALRERGQPARPIILTFSPCGSAKTLAFLQWLGIAVPRWLENDLRVAADPLALSLDLCERVFDEVWDYAGEKGIPLGVNVESVSIRKAEIDGSVELLHRLHRRIERLMR